MPLPDEGAAGGATLGAAVYGPGRSVGLSLPVAPNGRALGIGGLADGAALLGLADHENRAWRTPFLCCPAKNFPVGTL